MSFRELLKQMIPHSIRSLRRLNRRDIKDIPMNWRYRAIYLSKRRSGVLYFSPYLPNSVRAAIFKICCVKGWKMKEAEAGSSPVLFWPDRETPYENPVEGAINGHCLNINKDYVSDCFERVFDYKILIDPEAPDHPYVQKSVKNAAHDGAIFDVPQKRQSGFVYQRLLDNKLNEETVQDLRLIFVGEVLPLFYRKTRPIDKRFKNIHTGAFLEETSSYFSPSEISLVAKLCREIGLDYGELDVLRDRANGKIYVVDINRAPYGPHKVTSRSDTKIIVQMMGDFLSRNFGVGS